MSDDWLTQLEQLHNADKTEQQAKAEKQAQQQVSPINRSLPPDWASLERWYKDNFSGSDEVVVYWPAQTPTVVGYYTSVSAANAAATANIDGQRKPRVAVNFWHADFTHISLGGKVHRRSADADGSIDLPSWYDEEPAS